LEFEIEKRRSMDWLLIEPERGVVKGGEKQAIEFKLHIGRREAQLLFLHNDFTEEVSIKTNEPVTDQLHSA